MINFLTKIKSVYLLEWHPLFCLFLLFSVPAIYSLYCIFSCQFLSYTPFTWYLLISSIHFYSRHAFLFPLWTSVLVIIPPINTSYQLVFIEICFRQPDNLPGSILNPFIESKSVQKTIQGWAAGPSKPPYKSHLSLKQNSVAIECQIRARLNLSGVPYCILPPG